MSSPTAADDPHCAHDHAASRTRGGAHGHVRVHAHGFAPHPAATARPSWLRSSAAARLGVVGALLAALWLLVLWALS